MNTGLLSLFSSINTSSILFKYGVTLIHEEELVKDSLQDFFIYLWDRKAKLGEIRHLHSYLFIAFRRFLFQRAKDIAREASIQATLGYILPGESPAAELTAFVSENTRPWYS